MKISTGMTELQLRKILNSINKQDDVNIWIHNGKSLRYYHKAHQSLLKSLGGEMTRKQLFLSWRKATNGNCSFRHFTRIIDDLVDAGMIEIAKKTRPITLRRCNYEAAKTAMCNFPQKTNSTNTQKDPRQGFSRDTKN